MADTHTSKAVGGTDDMGLPSSSGSHSSTKDHKDLAITTSVEKLPSTPSSEEPAARKRRFRWRNFWICFAISLGMLGFGYPASVIATTLGQPSFLIYMQLITPEGLLTPEANGLIGATSGVFQAGAVIGILGGAYVMDKYGRKGGVIYLSTLSIVGGVIITASQNIAMFIVGRFFAGAGSWGFLALTPVYTAELAPAELRGFFVGMNGVMIASGYAIASYMGLAFYHSSNASLQWRGTLGVALIWPLLMLLIICLVPESPRYLLMAGKEAEAWKVISSLHADPQDPEDAYAKSEFYQMSRQATLDRTLNPSWLQIFRKPSYRRRVVLGMTVAFLGQSTAILVVNNYGPTFYKTLGFGTRDQLILAAGWITGGIPSNFLGAVIMDRFGRKPLYIFGIVGCMFCIVVEAAMVSLMEQGKGNPKVVGALGVAAFYVFVWIYGFGVDVASVVFYSELFPNHMRGKGVSLCVVSLAITDLVYLQATTSAFANIGWKYFLVFIIVMFLGTIWAFIYMPETKGRTLEEMAVIFGDEEDVVVLLKDIHVDHATNELVVEKDAEGEGLRQRRVAEQVVN